ncbi:hypothetical protein E3P86_01598 [Wallemia ichthyophaga]|uniref:Choline/carnitine acyltransferase domain-containing protein n=1 Tax=Wallemia ichthyophaga TaxID=245174 RepID=A0A4T0J6S3_WALIC|nr:hypothetical protein E3P86_01598 [Wallemia ichthyophaga]
MNLKPSLINKPADGVRPAIWKSLAPYISNHHLKLPALPVPSLENTADQVLNSIKPLTNDVNQFTHLEGKLHRFLANEGPALQQRLISRSQDPEHVNWLEMYWDDAAYMSYRDSVVVNVSYFYGFAPPKQKLDLPQYAARVAHHALQFRKLLYDGQIEPDAIGRDNSPICMNSYRFLFDACRIPAKPADYVSVQRQGIGHVAVVYRGNWWSIPSTTGDGTPLSISELEQNIEYILDQQAEEGYVGLLTTRNRDKWADDRSALLQIDKKNEESLAAIESAAVVITLDGNQAINSPVDKSRHLWHAGEAGRFSNNRFVDKPLQFICWQDESSETASGGFMGEHSCADGTQPQRVCDYVMESIQKASLPSNELLDQDTVNAERRDTQTPIPLPFNLDGLQGSINDAWNEIKELANSQVLGYILTNYGKGAIKKAGFSPDAWTQMVIQLAYSRLAAREGEEAFPAPTYEAAMTRSFANGRTECIRSATTDSATFTNAMNDPSKTADERINALEVAVKTHLKNAKQAGLAQGCDRHLTYFANRFLKGLKKSLLPTEPVPEIFNDGLLSKSGTWTLSTSQISSKYFDTYGWGEVVPSGFGVAYAIFEDYLQFTVTSHSAYGTASEKNDMGKERNEAFLKDLTTAANDMLSLFGSSERQTKL